MIEDWIESEVEMLLEVLCPWTTKGIVMGFPLWGDEFIARYQRYFEASLSANDGDTFAHLRQVVWTNEPEDLFGINVEVRRLPPRFEDIDRYTLLGACQKILFRVAHKSGCGWHGAMPDVVYPKGYFDRLLALSAKHEAILNLSLWVDQQKAGPNLNLWRQDDGTLAIPPVALGDIGWRCLHSALPVMNGRLIDSKMPFSHFLAWRGRYAVHMHCPHMAPHYLSPRLCGLAATLPVEPIDSQLPKILTNEQFYIPTPEDGLNAIELAFDKNDQGVGSFREFASKMWPVMTEPYMPFWRAECRTPVLPAPRGEYMTDAEISDQRDHIEYMMREEWKRS